MSEKFPWLFERKFGIAAYDYWYGYSAAKIELMTIDQPVLNWKTDKKKGNKSMFGTKEEADEMEALADAWKKQNGDGIAGKKVNLNEFIGRKV